MQLEQYLQKINKEHKAYKKQKEPNTKQQDTNKKINKEKIK